jgi:hypothetical protein
MMRMFRLALPLVAVSSLAGCALDPGSPYVSQVDTPADAQVLAAGMLVFVAAQLPRRAGLPVIRNSEPAIPKCPPRRRVSGHCQPDRRASDRARLCWRPLGTHHIRYFVTPLDSGDLVRVSIDDSAQASRFFVRNAEGGLQAGGPFLVRQSAEAG